MSHICTSSPQLALELQAQIFNCLEHFSWISQEHFRLNMSENPGSNFPSHLEWTPNFSSLLARSLITLRTPSPSTAPSLTTLQPHCRSSTYSWGGLYTYCSFCLSYESLVRASQSLFCPLHHSGLDSKFTFWRGFSWPTVSISLSWRL